MADTAIAPSSSHPDSPTAPATRATGGLQIDTAHGDAIHDSQFDYYGRYLATCSSDKTIKVWALTGSVGTHQGAGQRQSTLVADLVGHDAPVWMLAWAPPTFGPVFASCSYDGKVIVWREAVTAPGAPSEWGPVHVVTGAHVGSINAIAWAPTCLRVGGAPGTVAPVASTDAVAPLGATIASAGSDGNVMITSFLNGVWRQSVNVAKNGAAAHPTGAMAVSFAPFAAACSSATAQAHPPVTLLASGGCDGAVRVWFTVGSAVAEWSRATQFPSAHKEWVRDVAFSPDETSRWLVLASCSEDRTVVVRRVLRESLDKAALVARTSASDSGATTTDGDLAVDWEESPAVQFPAAVWRLSWSPCGGMLLATTADSQVFLLKAGATFQDPWSAAPVS